MLQLLLTEFVLYVETEGNGTLVFLTVLGMITTQSDELLANRATTIGFSLAALCVLNHSLHLLA